MAWNKPSAAPKPAPKKKPSALRGVAAGLVAVAVVAAGFFFLFSGDSGKVEIKKSEKKPSRIKEVTPAPAPTNAVANVPAKPKTFKERYRERFGDKPMNPARLALMSSAKVGIDMRTVQGDTNGWGEVRMIRYSNPVHRELAKYVHPGEPCDTPDMITDSEARKLCDQPVQYNFDDPDDVLEEKKAVETLTKELKKYLKDGGHAQQFFMELMERQDAEYATMQSVRKQITEFCREGDTELAQQAFEKYNEYLKGKGLPPVKMSPQMKHFLKKGVQKQ